MAAFRRIANLFRRSQMDREIAEELQAHIDLATEANMRQGLPHAVARRDAYLRFGNPASTRERVAAADAHLGLDVVYRDIRYALRQLLKNPGFTITAVLTLALGIGINTAIFSSMDAVVLRPLAVPALNRVVTVAEQRGSLYFAVTLANYEDWLRQSHSFEELAVHKSADMNLTGAGDAAQVTAALTSASFFSVLRVQPIVGRLFTQQECHPGSDGVALLNYGFWRRHFDGDTHVVGRKVQLDQREYTIIGVLPRSVQYPSQADVFIPLAPTPDQISNRFARGYLVLGRLRDGVTVKQAQAEMATIAARLDAAYPATNGGWTVHVEPLLANINGDLTPLYYNLVMAATLFVLLVVCANVANLQFARGIKRRPEIAMRTALGAGKWRIVRQLLTENILLAIAGAAGGLVIGALYLHLTLISMPERVARFMAGWSNISLNGRAFAFSFGLAVLAGVVSGFAPALDALRVNLVDQLKAGSRSTTGAGRSRRLRNVFAVAQVAMAVALVIGAALMSKGMWSMLHLADVYQPNRVLTFDVSLPAARYNTPRRRAEWYAASLDKLRALPGVVQADVTSALPYHDIAWLQDCAIENRPTVPGKMQNALRLPVSEGYFNAFHIRIVAGRGFTGNDTLDAAPVAVVSQRFVAQYFPGENPLGHRVRLGGKDSRDPWLTIVGVAAEANYSLWDQTPNAAVYMDAAQMPPEGMEYAIVARGDPMALVPTARHVLAGLDSNLPINNVETYAQLLHEDLIGLIQVAVMLGIDAAIALLLAAIGLFGVMANLVGEQTREIGVRLAMGARREDVLRMILRRASWLTGIGLVAGLLLAAGLSHVAANLLLGVRSNDPVVFSTVAMFIAAISLGASWIPARRAARVDPIDALRSE